ncbi:MAG: FliG C-terminal domain-containing protein [Elusimicrobiota bacterium]
MHARKTRVLLQLLALLAPASALAIIEAPQMTLVERREAIIKDSEGRIQKDILDPLLGSDKAKVFVDVDLEVRARRQENLKEGSGMMEKYKEKGGEKGQGFATQFILPGVPTPKHINKDMDKGKPESAQGITGGQLKVDQEEVYSQELVVKSFRVAVIHDNKIRSDKTKMIRSLIVDAMEKYKLKPEDVRFIPAPFHEGKAREWIDDLKEPKVYLPLLYAGLLLLLLMFLFGPFSRFLRRYTEALAQKPAAEINVESNIESPEEEGGGGGGGGGGPERSLLDIMMGQKPPEPPAEAEDEMKKFEPFTYISEENLKRLVTLFLLRREEPWLIAVVLSYLRPEYARRVLTSLPLELQAKVALEALTVRQVTREQVMAIDADIKESIDFVVGGIERLTKMLEEADGATRTNILEHLKNEKPAVYERVRKSILLFEDVASFPDRDMQAVVRELKTENMARALQNAPPEVVNKFFANMSAGAASLLKESMEYVKELTPAQLEEERTQIMDRVKSMEKEGKISVRKGADQEDFQEVLEAPARRPATGRPPARETPQEEAPAEAPAAHDPEGARRLFDSGVRLQEEGNLDEAVKHFRQALEKDPELWQAQQYLGTAFYQMGRTSESLIYFEKVLAHHQDPQLQSWVEGLKAQSQTT